MRTRVAGVAPFFVLIALLAATTVELVRASGPMFDLAFGSGVVVAALVALGTYAAPGLVVAALARSAYVNGRSVLAGVLLLVAARVAAQALDGQARFVATLLAVSIAVGVLVAAVHLTARPAPAATALALTTGVVGAAAISLWLGTWDAFWRHDALGGAVTCALLAATVLAAWQVRSTGERSSRGVWALGPYLAIMVMAAGNPAYLSSQLGLSLPWAGAAVVGGLGVSVVFVMWTLPVERVRVPGPATRSVLVRGLFLVAALVGVTFVRLAPDEDPGSNAVAYTVLASLLVGLLTVALATSLARPLARHLGLIALAGSGTGVGLGVILPLLFYQVDYDIPLGFPNALVIVATGAVLALAAVRASRRVGMAGEGAAMAHVTARSLVPTIILVAILGLTGAARNTFPTTDVEAAPATSDPVVRLLSWNVHFGVTPSPGVDLDRLADVIRDADADVVALQEVSRGWVMGGGADMATYLARATGMRFVAAPAADRQFVNVLLVAPHLLDPATQMPADVVRTRLPYGDGPQWRSAVTATVPAPSGERLTVTSVHLQHRATNTPTRLEQLDALLAAELADGSAVLAGDLNAEPGWPEPTLLIDAGWTSAQDTAGDPAALTFPATDPQVRIDWVLGRDVTFESLEVLDDATSDHRPLLAVVRVP